ncbi:MAG: amidohydrolase [Pyrinomonadaceae bacterium]
MKVLRQTLAVSIVLLLVYAPLGGYAQARRRVSLVLTNGKIFTADARGTIAQAVAVDGERIVAVGTNAEVLVGYEGARTIDLKGRLVTPGFNDAHLHFLNGGLSLLRVQLIGAQTLAEAKRRIAEKVKELPPGAWILGRGWDHTLWGGQWPTRQDLDEVAPNNPVFVQRVDGHVSWTNTLALTKANVTRATQAPEGGEILHDQAGEPTGILKETAGTLVGRVVPDPSRAERMQAIERALGEARRYGITSIQDNSGYENVELYRELLQADKLTVRVAEWQNFENTVDELKQQRAEFASFKIDPFRIRLTMLKGYVDGTLGSRTSAMLAPFADDPHNSGIPRHTPEELTRMTVERAQAGFQIGFHAIGDKANRMALDAFERTYKDSTPPYHLESVPPPPGYRGLWFSILIVFDFPRHRVEHAQVVAPADFARFRDLGVIASMQPSHAISDKRWAQDRLGEYRVMGAYAWHTMMAHGVHVPFGTDWPVEPINPYLGLYAAVTRQSTDGQPPGGWWPEERITIADAIRNYTAESAYASFEEQEKGQIAQGMLADLTVHSRDLLTIPPAEILQTEAVMTILGGRVVYEQASAH